MPIDTSSYYPEVPSPDGNNDGYSLNRREGGLFDVTTPDPAQPKEENKPEPLQPEPQKEPPLTGGERVVTKIAEIFSWVLTPLFMPVFGIILAFTLSILHVAPASMRINFTLIVFGIDVVLPMLLIVLLKKMNLIDDLGLNGRKERLIPYIITTVCYGATAWFMTAKGAPMWLSMFFAGGGLASLINLLINFSWKISAHAAGIAGIVALLIRIIRDGSPQTEIFTWLLISIVVAGLLGSARVWLCRHTVWQVVAGYIVGFFSVFLLTML